MFDNRFNNRSLHLRKDLEDKKTRSSWLNCALRDDEAVYWVSIGHFEAVAVGKDTRNCPEKVMKIIH